MSISIGWTTSADIRTKARRRWDDGSLLRAYARGHQFEPLSVPLRGPGPTEIGDDLAGVQSWIAELQAGSTARGRLRYTIEHKPVGGRLVGRNPLPSRAVISTWGEMQSLLGVGSEVTVFDELLALARPTAAAYEWAIAHPLQAIGIAEDWPALLAAYGWLDSQRDRGMYLRQVDVPGVDTKFIESHRGVLAQMLGARATTLANELGFASKPALLRLRFDAGFLGLPGNLSEATFRLDELAQVGVGVGTAVIVENEITYLSVPVPVEGVVIWGAGFGVDRPGSLPWLRDAEVHYWGDIDTHGFAIVDRLRAWLPQTKTFLMDNETLATHRDRWGREPKPTSAALGRLTPSERALYNELVTGHHGNNIRLEQERIDWTWAESRWPWD